MRKCLSSFRSEKTDVYFLYDSWYLIALDKSQDNVVPVAFAWFGGSLFALGIYQTFSV